ncbi:MAG: COX15/CtaA family protein [Chthoniobacterales bacterium]
MRDSGNLSMGRQAVHWYCGVVVLAAALLIFIGGLVTSKGAGMTVPDWPTSYGYNMFFFPISRWVGGIFYEHVHRLVASAVGLLTVILTVWLLIVEPRFWVKVMGVIATAAVILQGVLGGLRVTMMKNQIGIFHGMLAQSFLVLLGILFIVTSNAFLRQQWANFSFDLRLKNWALGATFLIFLQLGLGATMRHEHAGLSIPDFPRAYGKWWPPTDTQSITSINQQRVSENEMPTDAFQILLQMVHRLNALLVAIAVVAFTLLAFKPAAAPRTVRGWALVWIFLILCQITLGAWTIWSHKAADVATAHVALGALLLLLGSTLTFRLFCASHFGFPVLHGNSQPDMMRASA